MKTDSALDAVALQQWFALANFFENFAGEIFSFEKQTKVGFIQRRIIEQRQEHGCRRVMQQRAKLIAGGDTRAFTILRNGFGGNRLGHELTFRDFQRTRQGVPSEQRRGFGNWPRERASSGIVDHFFKEDVELLIEEGATVKNSPRLCKEEFCIPQLELVDHLSDLSQQSNRCDCQYVACRRVTGFRSFCDDRKYLGKHNGGLLARESDELHPGAAKSTADFVGQRKFFLVQELLEAASYGYSADVIGASCIANNRSKPTRARYIQRRSPPKNRGARSSDHHQAGDFSRSGKGEDQVTGDDNRGVEKAGF